MAGGTRITAIPWLMGSLEGKLTQTIELIEVLSFIPRTILSNEVWILTKKGFFTLWTGCRFLMREVLMIGTTTLRSLLMLSTLMGDIEESASLHWAVQKADNQSPAPPPADAILVNGVVSFSETHLS